ncbi:ANK-REP-region domain-containing protein [Favolaschia claudopus]|uniref:ANK-REP-region domain-containing protein n=1 Tax=Favolaschia claudopus TaxID=2862362 RepID=A0AAW0EF34_9AGAR
MLLELPVELVLHIASFLHRSTVLDPHRYLRNYYYRGPPKPEILPDLPSINALLQTNIALYRLLDHFLYNLCTTIEPIGRLALLYSVQNSRPDLLDRFIDAGVSLDSVYNYKNEACSLLHIAAAEGCRAMVVKLLGLYGEDAEARAYAAVGRLHKLTPLGFAARFQYMDIVQILAHIPPPPTSLMPSGIERRQYLSRALIQALKAGNGDISEYLISEGADVNFQERWMGPPLYCAAENGNLALLNLLLARGANPNGEENCVPLFHAAFHRKFDVMEALLAGGADMHVRTTTLLHLCTNVEVLRFFLKRGIDPNMADEAGRTFLHYVCCNETAWAAKASVDLLLEYGAGPIERADRAGKTAVDMAMSRGGTYQDIVDFFEPRVRDFRLLSRIAAWRKTFQPRGFIVEALGR